eukprot:scaffold82619_cov60-Phaeocystis_antarctica.AAC.1
MRTARCAPRRSRHSSGSVPSSWQYYASPGRVGAPLVRWRRLRLRLRHCLRQLHHVRRLGRPRCVRYRLLHCRSLR